MEAMLGLEDARDVLVGGDAFHQVRMLYIYIYICVCVCVCVCVGIERVTTQQITKRIVPSYNDDIDRGCRADSAGG